MIQNTSVCDKDVNIAEVIEVLPPWDTYILEGKMINEGTQLSLRFLLNAHNKEDIQRWLKELQDLRKTTYSIYCTTQTTGRYLDFKQRLVCQHKTRSVNVHDPGVKSRTNTKNTNCPSRLSLALHVIKDRYQGKDREKYMLMREMPCEVSFIATHNHDTFSVESLKFRKMSEEVKEKLMKMFHDGHSASTALDLLKLSIKSKHDNYEEIFADRKYCPTYSDCYYLYKQFKKEGGSSENSSVEPDLNENLEVQEMDTNEISPEETAKNAAMAALANINAIFSQFIDKSPLETAPALNSMLETMQNIKNPSTLAAYCANFGSSTHTRIQSSAIDPKLIAITKRKPIVIRRLSKRILSK